MTTGTHRPPAFQLYVKDWLTSRKIAVMDLSQVGAYIFLLAACWESDDCSLPDDDNLLAVLSRMGDKWFSDASAAVRACFVSHPESPGHITNLRLLHEFQSRQQYIREKEQAGRVGGIKSGQVRKAAKQHIVEAQAKHSFDFASSKRQANRTSSSSSSSSQIKNRAASSDRHLTGFDLFWKAYPKKRGKGQAESFWQALEPDDLQLGIMLAKIDQAKRTPQWVKNNGEFIPHPATWLNAKGWEDEYALPKARLVL